METLDFFANDIVPSLSYNVASSVPWLIVVHIYMHAILEGAGMVTKTTSLHSFYL